MGFMDEFEHLRIQLKDIKEATNNFGNKVIGAGGFGKVYAGEVSHLKGRSLVAIKRLDRKFGQGDPEFWKEIMMLSRYSHENLISLMGFCDEAKEKIVVYELASNGSLDRHLRSADLTWAQRIKICLDAARGLCYLHDDKGTKQRVLHRDIKSSNILLDGDWNAKISDMGLAKIGPANQEHTALVTNIVGTYGYLDPVYLQKGILTKESDVYSFGVVLFEVFSGRLCFKKSINGESEFLVHAWKQSYTNEKLEEVIFQDCKQPMDATSWEMFSEIAFGCLQDSRDRRPTMSQVVEKLEIALQFQERKLPEQYIKILKAAVPPLKYGSLEELDLLLSNGVILNSGKTWFSVNDKKEHYEMISIKECLIPEAGKRYDYKSQYNSRFQVGVLHCDHKSRFTTRVRAQLLSPNIRYTVNLVFKFERDERNMGKQCHIGLQYKLERETKSLTSYIAEKREDNWWMAELCQLTNDGTIVDAEIIYEGSWKTIVIEGIEFQPIEKVRCRRLMRCRCNMQAPISDSDDEIYWEQKLPMDYKDIIKWSKDDLHWTTKKELYSILSKGFLISNSSFFQRLFNNGQQWFSLDKNGKNCVMLSARAACTVDESQTIRWHPLPESRFGEVLVIYSLHGSIFLKENKPQILSHQTRYACYLVYQLEDASSSSSSRPVKVRDKNLGAYHWEEGDFWYIYLVSPKTPVLRPKVGENTYKSVIRPKLKGIPQQRSDGWMEVQVCEFQTDTTMRLIPRLELQDYSYFSELVIQGIELRPWCSTPNETSRFNELNQGLSTSPVSVKTLFREWNKLQVSNLLREIRRMENRGADESGLVLIGRD